jgi:NitT/TauT family transport system substrate-binding protein
MKLNNRSLIGAMAAMVLSSTALAACSSSDSDGGANASAGSGCDDVTTVRLAQVGATFGLGSAAYGQIPLQMGYYKDQCLDVKSTFQVDGSSGLVASLVTGNAEFGIAGPSTVMNALAEDPKAGLKVIYFTGYNNVRAVVDADSPLKTYADLAGKKVGATSEGASTKSLCELAASQQGAADPKIDWSYTTQLGSAAQALSSGKFDAWCGLDTDVPNFAGAKVETRPLTLPDGLAETVLPGGGIVTTDKFLADHPDVVEEFLRAVMNGTQFALTNPEATGFLMLKQDPDTAPLGDSPKDQVEAAKDVWLARAANIVPVSAGITPGDQPDDLVQKGVDLYVQAGLAPSTVKLDQWLDLSLFRKIAPDVDTSSAVQDAKDFKIPADYKFK